MKDQDTLVYIFGELIGLYRQYTLQNKGDINIAFLYEQSGVCRKKVNMSPVNIFLASTSWQLFLLTYSSSFTFKEIASLKFTKGNNYLAQEVI